MTRTLDPEVEELFHQALDLPAAERAAFLDQTCTARPQLRAALDELLATEARLPASFLSGPRRERERTTIPGYEILERIGEGGMGTVFAARQEFPRRDVAIKIVRVERATQDTLRRFRHEVEVLGQLQHPGIARIYEAGSTRVEALDGPGELPFFVMELVRGASLAEHSRSERLTLHQRLELFARVCDAVHYAHQHGVIHRDLKSENVLVTREGSAPGQPKVLDFGIARIVDKPAAERTFETRPGDLIGTLSGMSPEQAAGEGHLVDVRSDVYSLGALLFELLSGRPTLDLCSTSVAAALHLIREVDPPSLGQLDASLRGDVATIVAKALSKSPERRYQSAAGLADDLRRHVNGLAIAARADSAIYVLRKTVRRHRVLVSAAAILIVLLTVFGVVSSMQARRNSELARNADEARRRTEKALAESNIERGRVLAGRQSVRAEGLLWHEFLHDPVSPQAYWALWELFAGGSLLASRVGHEDRIWCARVDADESVLATAGEDGRIKLWDPVSIEERAVLAQFDSGVVSLEFDPSGDLLLAGCKGGTVVAFDHRSMRRVREFVGHTGTIREIDFHPDGEIFATAAGDGTVRVWNLKTGEAVAVLGDHGGYCWATRFSPDGGLLATAGNARIHLWAAPYTEPEMTLEGHRSLVTALAFSPGGWRLWSGGIDHRLRNWDLLDGSFEEFDPDNGTLRRLWIHPDGTSLMASGWWRLDRIDAETGETLASSTLPPMSWGVQVLADGERLLTGNNVGALRLASLEPQPFVARLPGTRGFVRTAVSQRGDYVSVLDATGALRLFDTSDGNLLDTIQTGASPAVRVLLHPQGDWFATTDSDGNMTLRDLVDETPLLTFGDVANETGRSVDVSASGRRIAAACGDRRFRVWDESDGSLLFEQRTPTEPLSVGLSPDGRVLATVARREHNIKLWSVADGTQIDELVVETELPWTVTFSPDGRHLAAGTWEQTVQLWDVEARALVASMPGHEGIVWDVTFVHGRPDLLASVSSDHSLRLWSLAEGREVAAIPLEKFLSPSGVHSAPDGSFLIVDGSGGEAVLIDLGYFDRHIAENLHFQLSMPTAEGLDEPERQALRKWSKEILARPWPLFAAWPR